MEKVLGVEFVLFYYMRGHRNTPCVTVCLAKEGDMYLRGVAICSGKDMPCKKTGRELAEQRVLRARRELHKMSRPAVLFKDFINIYSQPFHDFLCQHENLPIGNFDDFTEGRITCKTAVLRYEDLTKREKKLVDKKLFKAGE